MLCLHRISPTYVWISKKNPFGCRVYCSKWHYILLKYGNLYDPIFFLLSVTILTYAPLENRGIEVIETMVIRFFNWQGGIEKYMYNYCTLNRILRNSKCKIEWLPLVICKSTFLRIIKPSAAARMFRSFFLSLDPVLYIVSL